MNTEKAIWAVETAIETLRVAIDALERAAEEEFRPTPPHAILVLKQRVAEFSTRGIQAAVAEKRRPKGPWVTLEWTGREKKQVHAELIRRTATQVFVLRSDWSTVHAFNADTGNPAKRSSDDYLGHWRIRPVDMAKVSALAVGENAVSRALKAIAAGKYSIATESKR